MTQQQALSLEDDAEVDDAGIIYPPTQAWERIISAFPQYADGGSGVEFIIGEGFKKEIAARGWHAASDEVYFSQTGHAKLSVVSCDEGLMWYDSFNNMVMVTKKDSPVVP